MPPVHAVNNVSSNWFATMRIPILTGRTIGTQDPARPVLEALVSKSFARRYWKNESALGHRVHQGINGPWYTIVGVVDDVHLTALDQPAEEAVYFPLVMPRRRFERGSVARGARCRDRSAGASNLDDDSSHRSRSRCRPCRRTVSSRWTPSSRARRQRLASSSLMLGAASLVALVLGAVGIYGVMSYGVSLRQREIGVRMALGARPGDVSRMISRQGVVLAAIGVVIGLAGAIASTRMLRGLLYDVSPTDPLTLGATCAVLARDGAAVVVAAGTPRGERGSRRRCCEATDRYLTGSSGTNCPASITPFFTRYSVTPDVNARPAPRGPRDRRRDLIEARLHAGHLVLDSLRAVNVSAEREHVIALAQHGEHGAGVRDGVTECRLAVHGDHDSAPGRRSM